jgi:hypothetical protein
MIMTYLAVLLYPFVYKAKTARHRNNLWKAGADPGGGGRAPPKIGKNMILWRKIVISHTKYPKNFRASLLNWKQYNFLA